MKHILIIFLLFVSKAGSSQCTYSWVKTYNDISDTLNRKTSSIDIDDIHNNEIDFNKLKPKIRKYKFEDSLRQKLKQELDSLRNLPSDSSLSLNITNLELDLNSQFQIVKYGNFE